MSQGAAFKAMRVHEFGEPEVMLLEESPELCPVDDEILVRIHAAGVNPVDTYIRSGAYGTLPALPYTPGSDAAGVDVRSGARVYIDDSLSGAYAEFALCSPDQVFALPAGITFAQGAALGVPYVTAFRALFQRANAEPGETALVHGASGGVGLAVVQFALAAGLTVVGTAGSGAGLDLVAAQGAVRVVDHRRPDHLAEATALTGGRGFDLIVELRADLNLGRDLAALAPRGRVVVVGSRGCRRGHPARPDERRRRHLGHAPAERRHGGARGGASRHRHRPARRIVAARGGARAAARRGATGP